MNTVDNFHNSNKKAVSNVVFAVILWSTSFVAIKIGMEAFPPISFAAIRFGFAALILFIIKIFARIREKIETKDYFLFAIGVILGITILFTLHNIAMQNTTSANANLIVAPYEANITHRRIVGNLLVFIAGVSWAFYNIVTKKVVAKYSAFTSTFWQTLFGTLGLFLLSLIEIRKLFFPNITTLISALYLALTCSIGAYMLYGFGLKNLRPGLAVNLMNLQPGFGVIIAAVILGEEILVMQALGGAIIVIGVIVSVKFTQNGNANNTKIILIKNSVRRTKQSYVDEQEYK